MPQCVSEMVQVSNLYLQRGAAKILNKALLKFGCKPIIDTSFITQAPSPYHRAVSVYVQITCNKRGKGHWKVNNSFIEHEEYHDGIVRIYEEVMEEYEQYVTKPILWDFFKIASKTV